MRKKLSNILSVAAVVTTIAFIMDGDIPEPSMFMRFVEFFAMTGIFFIIISLFYFPTLFFQKKINSLKR